jgi:hypothetical protein
MIINSLSASLHVNAVYVADNNFLCKPLVFPCLYPSCLPSLPSFQHKMLYGIELVQKEVRLVFVFTLLLNEAPKISQHALFSAHP